MDYCGECGGELELHPDQNGRERKLCVKCGWVWFDNPVPVVLVLGVTEEGLVLYTRKNQWPEGLWGLVAGFVERGETAEFAALREVEEETGLQARGSEFIGTVPFQDQLIICFRVVLGTGDPKPGSDVDHLDLAPPQPERIPTGMPARWLLEQHLGRGGSL